MWYLISLILTIDILLIIILVSFYRLKVKQKKLNRMLNLYKAKRKLTLQKVNRHNPWNKKLALVSSLFLVVNITGVYTLQSSLTPLDNAKTSTSNATNIITSEAKNESIEDNELSIDLSDTDEDSSESSESSQK